MYLAEILEDKKLLDLKIAEVKSILNNKQTDDLAQELFVLLELRQSKLLNIDAANHASIIKIGSTELSVFTTVVIRDTIKEKIDVITALINNDDCDLDKIELQAQRDKHYGELILLNMAINRNDLQVTVDQHDKKN